MPTGPLDPLEKLLRERAREESKRERIDRVIAAIDAQLDRLERERLARRQKEARP